MNTFLLICIFIALLAIVGLLQKIHKIVDWQAHNIDHLTNQIIDRIRNQ